jgi:hypothetical protein
MDLQSMEMMNMQMEMEQQHLTMEQCSQMGRRCPLQREKKQQSKQTQLKLMVVKRKEGSNQGSLQSLSLPPRPHHLPMYLQRSGMTTYQ